MMLRIKNTKTNRVEFPLSEIILTNSSSRSVLVYLPHLSLIKRTKRKFFMLQMMVQLLMKRTCLTKLECLLGK